MQPDRLDVDHLSGVEHHLRNSVHVRYLADGQSLLEAEVSDTGAAQEYVYPLIRKRPEIVKRLGPLRSEHHAAVEEDDRVRPRGDLAEGVQVGTKKYWPSSSSPRPIALLEMATTVGVDAASPWHPRSIRSALLGGWLFILGLLSWWPHSEVVYCGCLHSH